jgi:hypothetical protein
MFTIIAFKEYQFKPQVFGTFSTRKAAESTMNMLKIQSGFDEFYNFSVVKIKELN